MLFRGSGASPKAPGGPATTTTTSSGSNSNPNSTVGLAGVLDGSSLEEDHQRLLRQYCDDVDFDDDGADAKHGAPGSRFGRHDSENTFSVGSTSSSYTSATSTAAQSFNQRMALLADGNGMMGGVGEGGGPSNPLLVASQMYPVSAFDPFSTDTLFFPDHDNTAAGTGMTDSTISTSNRTATGTLPAAPPAGSSPASSYTAFSERVASSGEATASLAMPSGKEATGGRGGSDQNKDVSNAAHQPARTQGVRSDPFSDAFTVVGSSAMNPYASFSPSGNVPTNSHSHSGHSAFGVAPPPPPPPPPFSSSQHPIPFPGVKFYTYPTPEYFASRRLEAPSTGAATAGDADAKTNSSVEKASSAEKRAEDGAESPSSTGQELGADAQGGSAEGASSHTGAKLFLGGLRFEVIQAGRHVVSWIFEAACGVRLCPSTILIHRRSKSAVANHGSGNGANKNAIAPTGCASVFVADEKEMEQLLEMSQRVFCASTGIYVADSADRMRQLLAFAQKRILEVVDGKIRGPTHPIVVERANSSSSAGGGAGGHRNQKHGGHHNSNNTNNNYGGGHLGSGNFAAGGGGGPHPGRNNGRRGLSSNASSSSDFLAGSGVFGPQGRAGGPPPPPYAAVSGSNSALVSGNATPLLGSTPASTVSGFPTPPALPFSLGGGNAPFSNGLPASLLSMGMGSDGTGGTSGGGAAVGGASPVNPTTVAAAMLELLQQQQQQQQQQQHQHQHQQQHYSAELSALAAVAAAAAAAANSGNQANPFLLSNQTAGLQGVGLGHPNSVAQTASGSPGGSGGMGHGVHSTSPAPPIAESHLSFHVYPGDAAIREAFGHVDPTVGTPVATATASGGACGAFLGGLPPGATVEYVSWMLSLTGLRVTPEHIQMLGARGGPSSPLSPPPPGNGSTNATPPSEGSGAGSSTTSTHNPNAHGVGGATAATGCATAVLRSVDELAVLLGFRDRLLPTRRGVWLGRNAATLQTLVLEDPSLADCLPLYIERRNMGGSSLATGSAGGGAGPRRGNGGFGGMSSAGAPPPPPPPPPFVAGQPLPPFGVMGSNASAGAPPPPPPPPYSGAVAKRGGGQNNSRGGYFH